MPKVVLIVEDNNQVLLNLIDIIELSGYSVLVASTENRALEFIETVEIDLILSDVHLQNYNDFTGLTFAEALKRLGIGIPVLFQSADARPTTRTKVEVYGKLILKPFGAAELLQAIKEVLGDATR